MSKQIELGNKVRCLVSGFTGIATARIEYLNGCIQYGINPGVDKDGKPQDTLYLDVNQLVDEGISTYTEAKKVKAEVRDDVERTGGPDRRESFGKRG